MSVDGVVGGRLKLKGGIGIGKKKKKSKQKQAELAKAVEEDLKHEEPTEDNSKSDPANSVQLILPSDPRTEAQKKFEEAQARRERERAAKAATKSHRQKVDEFNEYLENLSEHYDIPRVGPG